MGWWMAGGEKSCLRGNGKKIELGRKKECSTVVVVERYIWCKNLQFNCNCINYPGSFK
jgi:hypothetical protein